MDKLVICMYIVIGCYNNGIRKSWDKQNAHSLRSTSGATYADPFDS